MKSDVKRIIAFRCLTLTFYFEDLRVAEKIVGTIMGDSDSENVGSQNLSVIFSIFQ